MLTHYKKGSIRQLLHLTMGLHQTKLKLKINFKVKVYVTDLQFSMLEHVCIQSFLFCLVHHLNDPKASINSFHTSINHLTFLFHLTDLNSFFSFCLLNLSFMSALLFQLFSLFASEGMERGMLSQRNALDPRPPPFRSIVFPQKYLETL